VHRPVARLDVAAASKPRLRVKIDEVGERAVFARVVVERVASRSVVVARISLGRVPTGRTVPVRWPSSVTLRAGHYVVLVHAHDSQGRQLRRVRAASGRLRFVVHGTPHRKPASPPAGPVVTPGRDGVFPVAGAHNYGDGFGAPRKGYSHQGQDVLGARGTPIVAPLDGTIYTLGYQASAAGEYVVLAASDGHAYFFAHCIRHSTAVSAGQAVVAGAQLCQLGATGDATGPHLHFEEWIGGWRVDKASRPIDPLPQLRAWDR
jgi:murein DD-endopeptidase MepM/ murein hydrolase activator NlpD